MLNFHRSQVSNPDVLGSIFEGLETLHSCDSSITREGNVKRKNVVQMDKETPTVGEACQVGESGHAGETGQAGQTAQAGVTGQAGQTCQTGETNQTRQTIQSLKTDGAKLKVKFKLPEDTNSIKDDETAEGNSPAEPQIKEENTKNEMKLISESKQVVNYISAEKSSSKSLKFQNQETNCKENQLNLILTTSNVDFIPDSPCCQGNSLTNTDDKVVERRTSVVKHSSVLKRPSRSHSDTQKPSRTTLSVTPVGISSTRLPTKLSSYKIPKIIQSTSAPPLKQEAVGTNACSDVRTSSERLSRSRENSGNNSRFYDNSVMGITETPPNQASEFRKRNTPLVEARSSSSSFSGHEIVNVPPWKRVRVSRDFVANEQSKPNLEKALPSSLRKPLLKLGNSTPSTTQKSVHFGPPPEPSSCISDWGSDKINNYGPHARNVTVTETDTRKKQNLDIINTLRHKTLDLRAQLLREMLSGES